MRHYKTYDELIEKRYWTIGEVKEMLGLERTCTIRFWLQYFGWEVHRNRKGVRQFNAQDVERVKLLYYLLKIRKFTLEGAKMELQNG